MKNCENPRCEKSFKPPKHTSRFCSNVCKHEGSRSPLLSRVCKRENCTVEFRLSSSTSRKVYCSTSCSNINRAKLAAKYCRNCKAELPNKNSTYCSNSCHNDFKYNQYIQNWLDGVEPGGTSYGCSEPVRRWIRERYGLFCWECGWNKHHPLTGEPPLQIDHIDGNASNNIPDNLRLLCGGCHSLTPTYGNRGSRKSSRTARYDKSK